VHTRAAIGCGVDEKCDPNCKEIMDQEVCVCVSTKVVEYKYEYPVREEGKNIFFIWPIVHTALSTLFTVSNRHQLHRDKKLIGISQTE